MFRNREIAGQALARALRQRSFRDPIVLAIPRGGIVLGAVLARELNADLDVVLARKLRAPDYPELAIGAISEDGSIYLDPDLREWAEQNPEYLAEEIRWQKQEIARRQELFRAGRPAAELAGRSVLVVDDGIATGSTVIAALHAVTAKSPHEVLVVVPVASRQSLETIRPLCNEVVCLLSPADFHAVGQFYADFRQVDDAEVVARLREREVVHDSAE